MLIIQSTDRTNNILFNRISEATPTLIRMALRTMDIRSTFKEDFKYLVFYTFFFRIDYQMVELLGMKEKLVLDEDSFSATIYFMDKKYHLSIQDEDQDSLIEDYRL